MGIYFKKVCFLGNGVPLENDPKECLNEFKLKWKLHENVAKGFFFNMNKLILGIIACAFHILASKKTSKLGQTWQCGFLKNERGWNI